MARPIGGQPSNAARSLSARRDLLSTQAARSIIDLPGSDHDTPHSDVAGNHCQKTQTHIYHTGGGATQPKPSVSTPFPSPRGEETKCHGQNTGQTQAQDRPNTFPLSLSSLFSLLVPFCNHGAISTDGCTRLLALLTEKTQLQLQPTNRGVGGKS